MGWKVRDERARQQQIAQGTRLQGTRVQNARDEGGCGEVGFCQRGGGQERDEGGAPPNAQERRARRIEGAGTAAKAGNRKCAPLDASSLLARVIRLESERDRLQAELATATSRIQALEESREQVVNRIDWVIDSLRNLIDD